MKERTESLASRGIALVIAIVIGLLALIPNSTLFFSESVTNGLQKLGSFMSVPSMFLVQYSIIDAINAFEGDMGREGFTAALIFGLSGIAVVLIIAPTLMVKGYQNSEEESGKIRPLFWHIGTAIILAAVGIGFFSSINWSISKKNFTESASMQRTMDELRLELADLSFDASAKMILPHEMGGGDGSFTNFIANNGSYRTITLADLDRYNPNSSFEFVIRDTISDSTITITGITGYEGRNSDFQNADGRTGHIQLSVTVHPYKDFRLNFKNENEILHADLNQ